MSWWQKLLVWVGKAALEKAKSEVVKRAEPKDGQ